MPLCDPESVVSIYLRQPEVISYLNVLSARSCP